MLKTSRKFSKIESNDMPHIKKKPGNYSFFDDVYEVVKLIPKGRVTSYGAIAHFLGLKSSARMVGWAMNSCPKGLPAHRVVNSSGLLTGKHHFKTTKTMQRLLEKEGLKISNDKINSFSAVFWDPTKELSLK